MSVGVASRGEWHGSWWAEWVRVTLSLGATIQSGWNKKSDFLSLLKLVLSSPVLGHQNSRLSGLWTPGLAPALTPACSFQASWIWTEPCDQHPRICSWQINVLWDFSASLITWASFLTSSCVLSFSHCSNRIANMNKEGLALEPSVYPGSAAHVWWPGSRGRAHLPYGLSASSPFIASWPSLSSVSHLS